MRQLYLHSERFGPTGNSTSEGVLNQLGRPNLDLISLLVREAVQNSWDARRDQRGGVTFRIDLSALTDLQLDTLAQSVFADVPPSLPLTGVLEGVERPRVLVLSDHGTIGLGGPTRADIPTPPGQPRDFIDFLRNVGHPPDRPMTGGTYGYGKAASYLASRGQTICVYTRWEGPDGFESRFIAAALGGTYQAAGPERELLTGRHWWGVERDGIAEPVVGEEADEIGAALGLRVRSGNDTGTSIIVIAPDFGETTPQDAIEQICASVLWNFWPKMLPGSSGVVPIAFRFVLDGAAVAVPEPAEYPPLEGYVQALGLVDAWPDFACVPRV